MISSSLRTTHTLVDLLDARERERSDKILFRYLETGEVDGPSSTLTPAELKRAAMRVAAALDRRLGRGDGAPRVALLVYPPGLEFISAIFGCLLAGVVAVPAYPPQPDLLARGLETLGSIITDARPSCVLMTSPMRGLMGAVAPDFLAAHSLSVLATDELEDDSAWAPPAIRPEDIALLQYTSGSTSRPRGVVLTHENLVSNLRAIVDLLQVPKGSLGVNWLPTYHDMGLIGNIFQTMCGEVGELVLMSPLAFLERPLRWLLALSHFRATATGGPNFAYDLCARRVTDTELGRLDLSAWEVAICGAEPVRASTLDRFAKRFGPVGFRREAFTPCYGLAESTLLVASVDRRASPPVLRASAEALKRGRLEPLAGGAPVRELVSCGPPRGEQRVVIVEPEAQRPLPAGSVGEIWVAGPSVSPGYWSDTARDGRAVFGLELPGEPGARFLCTGDLGALVDGELYITGRSKDVVIVRGENYDANDIEGVAEEAHPSLRRGCVVAFADARDDEESCVVIAEVRARLDAEVYAQATCAMRTAVAERLGLRLSVVELVPPRSLPKTSSGKLQRSRTRQLWAEGALKRLHRWGAPAAPPPKARGAMSTGPRPTLAQIREELERSLRFCGRLPASEQIDWGRGLRAAGLDSLALTELRAALEASFGGEVSPSVFEGDPAVSILVERLYAQLGSPVALVAAAAVGAAPDALPRPEPRARERATPGSQRDDAPLAAGDVPALSVMFFSADDDAAPHDRYDLVREASVLADRLGFEAVWIPERHFHRFGGLFPNPSVVAAHLAALTSRIRLRAGSVVLPLHDPIRVTEEWAVVDNLSRGRVDLAFAKGWDADSFVLAPDAYEHRLLRVLEGADTVARLWQGEAMTRTNGVGRRLDVALHPPPIQRSVRIWLTATRGNEVFELAGRAGYNVLTALLFRDLEDIAEGIRIYRRAREQAGLDPRAGQVSLMLHAFAGPEGADVRAEVRAPMMRYLRTSVDLWQRESAMLEDMDEATRDGVLSMAFERYIGASLIGDAGRCYEMLRRARAIGVDEVACLIDFGMTSGQVFGSLRHLARLRERTPAAESSPPPGRSVPRRPALDAPAVAQFSPAGWAMESLAAAPAARSAPIYGGNGRTDPASAVKAFNADVRHALNDQVFPDVFERAKRFTITDELRGTNLLPFYLEFSDWEGTHATVDGRRVMILSALDYLGLSCDVRVKAATAEAALRHGTGRSGSRVHSGTTPEHRRMEVNLARFLGREDALICTTGYQTMAGVVTALMGSRTTLVVDQSVHASILDGASIARCRVLQFSHNDPDDLARTLDRLGGAPSVLVMIEGLYSNDGDIAPLPELRRVCGRYGVRLALDDAHGLGVLGATGRGTEEMHGCVGAADIIAGTFSKSLASIGGWIAADRYVIEWIRYHGRSILFTAAIAPPALAAASKALDVLMEEPQLVRDVNANARLLRRSLQEGGIQVKGDIAPVVRIPVGDDMLCVQIACALFDCGIYVHTVLYPSVPRDEAMLRLCVSAMHKPEDLVWAAGVVCDVCRELRYEERRTLL